MLIMEDMQHSVYNGSKIQKLVFFTIKAGLLLLNIT